MPARMARGEVRRLSYTVHKIPVLAIKCLYSSKVRVQRPEALVATRISPQL